MQLSQPNPRDATIRVNVVASLFSHLVLSKHRTYIVKGSGPETCYFQFLALEAEIKALEP